MAPRLPTGEADNWATPLTQQEADYIWSVLGWAAKKGISLNPETLLSLPSVSTGPVPVEPIKEEYQQRYSPTVSLYADLAGPDELLSPQQIIATYVMQGKTPRDILQKVKENPEDFPLATGSDFEKSTDYVKFIGSLTDEWSTYERVYSDDIKKYESDKSNYITDPYSKLNLPPQSQKYDTSAVFARPPIDTGGRPYKSTPQEDALLLAMARAVDEKYIIPGLDSSMVPTTSVPASGALSGETSPVIVPSRPVTSDDVRKQTELNKGLAAAGLTGLSVAGPFVPSPTFKGAPGGQPGPSRPVVTKVPKVDNSAVIKQKVLLNKLNAIRGM